MDAKMPVLNRWALVVSICLLGSVAEEGVATSRVKSTAADQRSMAVTVYNRDLGLVKEVRELKLPTGLLELDFEGVAARIDPTSVHIRSLQAPAKLRVIEQNFEYDLVSPAKLMEKYLGREVELVSEGKGKSRVRKARLIGLEGGYVYEIEGKLEIDPLGRVVLPSLPEGLISRPSLIWLLENEEKEHQVEVSYLTSGMSWHANYVVVLSREETKGGISGWVTVDNKSGASYREASLKLVAGEVHRVKRRPERIALPQATTAVKVAAGRFEERELFEYHVYQLEGKTTLKNNQTKQLRLMEAGDVDIHKLFLCKPYRGFLGAPSNQKSKVPVGVYLSFQNSKRAGLGMPLPGGIVRVYKKDEDGSLEFLGEDRIDHTPEDEEVRLKIGEAFDIVAERVQEDFRETKSYYESTILVTIRNHKTQPVTVSVVEVIPGDWKIKQKTHDYVKESAHQVRFDLHVPAKGKTDLRYTVSIKR